LYLDSSSNISSTPTGLEVSGQAVAYGIGVTDNGLGVAPGGTPALLGHANDQAFQNGVMGYATSGNARGVLGDAINDGTGVFGSTDSGVGVQASSKTGRALWASAGTGGTAATLVAPKAGSTALAVGGVASFSRSGIATVAGTTAAPKSSVKVTGVPLGATSIVLATLQQVSGAVAIKAAVPNVAASSFTIYLTEPVSTSINIGWFILN
jgi:hypothetical protein